MYELFIAGKYLKPSWKNLSVSLISLLSIGVIALVVWLVVVFFSVTHGLERSWINKVIGLAAPIRITPTEEYYRSYFHRIDGYSAAADYTTSTIEEKFAAPFSDPYDPSYDAELPEKFPLPDLSADGTLNDPVKKLYAILHALKEEEKQLFYNEFILSAAQINLVLLRPSDSPFSPFEQNNLGNNVYLTALNEENEQQKKILLSPTPQDFDNILRLGSVDSGDWTREELELFHRPSDEIKRHFSEFFKNIAITQLQPTSPFWLLPPSLYPKKALWQIYSLDSSPADTIPKKIIVPSSIDELEQLYASLQGHGNTANKGQLHIENGQATVIYDSGAAFDATHLPLFLTKNCLWNTTFQSECLPDATTLDQLLFTASTKIQGTPLQGTLPFRQLTIAAAEPSSTPFELPSSSLEKTYLPRHMREAGVKVFDRGYIAYQAIGASALQEQRLPIVVAGFFDPGLLPFGSKLVLAPKNIIGEIRSALPEEELPKGNGIEIHVAAIENIESIKERLEKALHKANIAPYWHIETFRDYDFTKDLLQQLSSERHLFTLLALIIILVACSNIVSMLIILVNDKKIEIAILRALGASTANIAFVFGLCGVVMGFAGSALGILLAAVTLRYLNYIIAFISHLQGYELFNPHFYGKELPTQLSVDALIFVFIATALISLLSGLIPAIKAACVKPSEALKSE